MIASTSQAMRLLAYVLMTLGAALGGSVMTSIVLLLSHLDSETVSIQQILAVFLVSTLGFFCIIWRSYVDGIGRDG